MTQRNIYTKLFEAVLPTVLEKLTKDELISPAARKDCKGPIEDVISIANNIAWKASFNWVDSMQAFMVMDAEEQTEGTPQQSVAKVQGMSLAEYEMGTEDPGLN